MTGRLLAAALACGVAATQAVAAPAGASPPNVLLVSIDSLRADRLGAYGNARDTSPTIDRLAREGVRFARALSPTSWTLPAHATLLTGQWQRTHQVLTTSDTLSASVRLLPEVFAAHGYETAGFFSGPFLHPAYGFARGFDSYRSCQSERTAALEGEAAWKSAQGDRTNAIVEAAFQRWIAERSGRPFFAFVHMWDVHYDYVPPEPYASMFDGAYDGPLDGRDIAGKGFPRDASRRDVAHLLALYDGEIRHTDATLGRMLDALEAAGQLQRTLVVVTADHGEEFLEHGGTGHQRTLYDEVLHVPLVLWASSGLPRGKIITQAVSLADVAPTVLELAGLPPLPAADGRSLVPLLRGEAAPRPVFGALYHPRVGRLRFVSVEVGGLKLVHAPPAETWSAFDLTADPGETAPRPAPDGPLRRALEEYATGAATALAARPDAGRRTPEGLPLRVVEHLRALGYLK